MQVTEKLVSPNKPVLPPAICQALRALAPECRGDVVLKYIDTYIVTGEELQWALAAAGYKQWLVLATTSTSPEQVVQYAIAKAQRSPQWWGQVVHLLVGLNYLDQALDAVLAAMQIPNVPTTHKEEMLLWALDFCLCQLEASRRLNHQMITVFAACLAIGTDSYWGRLFPLTKRAQIAFLLGRRDEAKHYWQMAITGEARHDMSDFGEDNDRHERLLKLHAQAVTMFPEAAVELGSLAVEKLVQANRIFMAAQLARFLGYTARARALFRERMVQLLQLDCAFLETKLGDCAFLAGDYEVAYGYYAVAENDLGKFKAAWEFDRDRAMQIAHLVAAKGKVDPYEATHGAAEVALLAALPEGKEIYELAIKTFEQGGNLQDALKLARLCNDTERIIRYEALLS